MLTQRHSRSAQYLIHCATAALLVGFSLSTFPVAGAETSEGSVPMSVLKKCAGIDEQLKRLACYDQVVEGPAGVEHGATEVDGGLFVGEAQNGDAIKRS